MTIKNADMPAMPLSGDAYTDFSDHCYKGGSYNPECQGLTKRETFCLRMGVAETGDAELDAIIRKGNLQKMAAQIMSGLASAANSDGQWTGNGNGNGGECWAVRDADALLAELERTNG